MKIKMMFAALVAMMAAGQAEARVIRLQVTPGERVVVPVIDLKRERVEIAYLNTRGTVRFKAEVPGLGLDVSPWAEDVLYRVNATLRNDSGAVVARSFVESLAQFAINSQGAIGTSKNYDFVLEFFGGGDVFDQPDGSYIVPDAFALTYDLSYDNRTTAAVSFSELAPSYELIIGTVPVPEPTSWAMMIAGVGIIGGALRRRTVRTAVTFA